MDRHLVLRYIAPYSIDSWSMAHHWILTCKFAHKCAQTFTWFWEPFLNQLLEQQYMRYDDIEWIASRFTLWYKEPHQSLDIIANVKSFRNDLVQFHHRHCCPCIVKIIQYPNHAVELAYLGDIQSICVSRIDDNFQIMYPCGARASGDIKHLLKIYLPNNRLLFQGEYDWDEDEGDIYEGVLYFNNQNVYATLINACVVLHMDFDELTFHNRVFYEMIVFQCFCVSWEFMGFHLYEGELKIIEDI